MRDALTLAEVARLPAMIDSDLAARITGTSPRTVRAACERGEFKCFKPGGAGGLGSWRIVTASFLDYCGLSDEVGLVRELIGDADGSRGEASAIARAHATLDRPLVAPAAKAPIPYPSAARAEVPPTEPEGCSWRRARVRQLSVAEIRALPDELGVEEAAALSRRSSKTIRRYVADGRLACYRRGGRIVIPKRAVIETLGVLGEDGLGAEERRRLAEVRAMPERITTGQAALVARRSAKTIRRLVAEGRLEADKRAGVLALSKRQVARLFGVEGEVYGHEDL